MPELEDQDEGTDQDQKNWRRELEARAKKGDEAVKRLELMERRDAFRSAGLDPDDKKLSYFVKGYEGELTKEAIVEEATSAGLIAAPDPAQTEHPAADTMDKIGEVASTSTPVSNSDVETRALLEKIYDEGGTEALMDELEKRGIQVSTRQ